ncbi:LysR family transcriptional regulator [Candidatus Halocynthiibacter alkanivorans]|uniref:LysR family transcriptional regulator n=1 Tax=Candidatus Halocynthiibacter alkanivorans TaxID=2267619 RepID=UPI000DF2217C|nr:LysR family transcriptional regulator [Candidatus Halocynthiibacter alkanivorans]
MDTKCLIDVLVLRSEGNFRIAAEQRGVSQPAFSRRIQALEAWVGAALIDRAGHPLQLTEAGRLFLPVAQKIVDLAEAGKADVQTLVLEENEKMRFSTLATLSQIFIPGWLKGLLPFIDVNKIVVKTEYGTIASYISALEANSVDFFVSYLDPKIGLPGVASAIASLTLGTETLVPVVSPNKDGSPRWWLPDRPEGPIPCLHTHSDDSPWPIKNHMENKYTGLIFRSVYDSSIGTALKEMAAEGFGLAWMPRTFVEADLTNGRLVRAAGPEDDIHVDIKIFRCLKSSQPRVEKFWNVLLQQQMRAFAPVQMAAD